MSEGTSGAGLSNRGAEGESREGDGKALVTYNRAPSIRGNDQDFIRRSEIDALIKMLKDNDNIHGYSFGASMIARTLEISPNVSDIARINETRIARDARTRYDFARLGIKMTQDQNTGGGGQQESSYTPIGAVQTLQLDHEGGNEPEPQESGEDGVGLSEEGEESNPCSHNLGDQSQREGETKVQTSSEEQEPSVHESALQPVLRRSTRLRKDPSSWVNTRVYYNAHAVEHPSQEISETSGKLGFS
ncbi:hypothetical protein F2Q69_00028956 [Brassica cretica]|uniref:Uncharacterized protein n=1 Tax=Brassica cretica TaxID=69181 RepID=A0A8S9S6I9_BRACR|nr:hypothetical protein F2Q69_00028956 [Brassica cretica]